MRFVQLILFLSLFLSACSVDHQHAKLNRLIPVKDLQRDVDYAYRKLQKNHPRLDLYLTKAQIDYKFDSFKQTIDKPLKPNDFYAKFYRVIGSLKHGHTDLIPVEYKTNHRELKRLKNTVGPLSQLTFFWENDSIYLVKSLVKDSILKPGSQLLRIDSVSPYALKSKYSSALYGDGYNSTYYQNRLNRNFIHYFYSLENIPKDSIQFTFSYQGKVYQHTIRRYKKEVNPPQKISPKEVGQIVFPQPSTPLKKIKPFQYSLNPSTKAYTRTLTFPTNDSAVAILKIANFSYGDYKKDYAQIFQEIHRYQVKNLILDLRNNGGGRLADAHQLFTYLVEDDSDFLANQEITSRVSLQRSVNKVVPWYTKPLVYPLSLLTYFITHTNASQQIVIGPSLSRLNLQSPRHPYEGNLYVLINGGSYSSSALLATNLKEHQRAYFVGEETGGDEQGTVAGFMPKYKLPHSKLKLSIGSIFLQPHYIESSTQKGHGLMPHQSIKPGLNDRLKNIDPELNWVLADIKNGNQALLDKIGR